MTEISKIDETTRQKLRQTIAKFARLIDDAEDEFKSLSSENDNLSEELSAARRRPLRVSELADALAVWARSADKREVDKVTQSIAGGVVGACWQIAGEVSKP